MSEPFFLAINCRRSGSPRRPWTAHWVDTPHSREFGDKPGDEEGGFLVFVTDNYDEFETAVLQQIERLKTGGHGHRYVGANTMVELSADCGTCKRQVKPVTPAVSAMIERFNKKHASL